MAFELTSFSPTLAALEDTALGLIAVARPSLWVHRLQLLDFLPIRLATLVALSVHC